MELQALSLALSFLVLTKHDGTPSSTLARAWPGGDRSWSSEDGAQVSSISKDGASRMECPYMRSDGEKRKEAERSRGRGHLHHGQVGVLHGQVEVELPHGRTRTTFAWVLRMGQGRLCLCARGQRRRCGRRSCQRERLGPCRRLRRRCGRLGGGRGSREEETERTKKNGEGIS